ncbi:hypothetical protein D3OALGA1CA_2278 [Olavius algarvensis associated proteobacterium Delta 3]|nr:hypothetical protein D3OALGA1CA_2278 [Olavius algarvensis associated proteobacterium Delta 3]CAB5165305.1 hypothetical protein D3OALGB2SA_5707 [Olavius algarvensis associated proteobacterium Delta 3]
MPRLVKTVLLVDDEKALMDSLKAGLRVFFPDIHFEAALNGSEALKIMQSRPVDLVVTDIRMPGMDGYELVSMIRYSSTDVPVIAMSAFESPKMKDTLSDLGVLCFLEKPLSLQELVGAIQEGLRQNDQWANMA